MDHDRLDARLTSAAFFQDPWPVYAELRATAPVYWCEPWGQWVVTRHDDVSYVLRQPDLFSSSGWEARYLSQLPPGSEGEFPELYRHYGTSVLSNADPPAHTRLRRLVHRSFTPRVIAALQPDIEKLTAQLLGEPATSTRDWVAELAYPLPATVIALLFGAPVEDCRRFERWSADIVAFIGSGSPRVDLARQEERSLREFRAYLGELIGARRVAPRDDLLSLLIAKSDDGEQLSPDELVSTCITLLFAGHETTATLLSALVLELLRHPDQWDLVVADPALVPKAVEETLRFNGPVQRVRRVATADVMLNGQQIHAGQPVMAFLGSANRDEAVFDDADTFDIRRPSEKHLAFGGGIHFCVGAALSRLEAGVVLRQLVERFPRARLSPEFRERYRENMTFRGIDTLPIELAP